MSVLDFMNIKKVINNPQQEDLINDTWNYLGPLLKQFVWGNNIYIYINIILYNII